MKKFPIIGITAVLCVCICFIVYDYAGKPSEALITSETADASTENAPYYALRTSSNDSYYCEITLDGNQISIMGKLDGYRITRVFLDKSEKDGVFAQADDGSFTAHIDAKGQRNGFDNVVFSFDDAKSIYYRVDYSDRWYFDNNGLSAANMTCLEHITTTPPEAVRCYLSVTGDTDKTQQTLVELQTLSDELCKGITSDYEKAITLCKWVSENIYYDFDARETNVTEETIAVCNVLQNRRTTCAGFANTYAALLQAQGIRAVNIKGSSVAGTVTYENLDRGVENHEWVAIELDGRWFFADATWNTSNAYRDGVYIDGRQSLMYFDPTDEAFAFNHRADRAQERDYFGCLDNTEGV